MKEAKTIIELSDSYLIEKRRLNDYRRTSVNKPYCRLDISRKIVDVIETRAKELNERDYFIIYNEVLLGKRNIWYLDYMSQATYYRHRKKAYENFIEALKR